VVAALAVLVVGIPAAALIGVAASGFECSGGAFGEGCSAPSSWLGWLVGITLGLAVLVGAGRILWAPRRGLGGVLPYGTTVAHEVSALRRMADLKGWELRELAITDEVARMEVRFRPRDAWRPLLIDRRADGRVEVTMR